MWLEKPLLPAYIKQEEYKGKYQSAELSIKARELMVEKLLERANSDILKQTLEAWIFLYYTGSRAESLTNFVIEGEFKVRWSEFVKVYGTDTFVVVRTSEKGKRGRKFTWRKLVPKHWAHLIPKRPLTPRELMKVRKITREILEELLSEKPELFNSDTIKYIKDAQKVLHLFRHTFAREALKAFKWNRYLVAKLGGLGEG
jgi:hypothetical protein